MRTYKETLLNYYHLTENDIKHRDSFPYPYLGLSHPKMEAFFKDVVKKDIKHFLITMEKDLYELRIIYAYALGKVKDFEEAIFFFDKFVPSAKDWSVVDTLCQKFVIARKNQAEVFALMQQYARVDDEYVQRIVAVILLSHFLNDTYIDETLETLKLLTNPAYFTKMGVAWALATINAKYPEKGIHFLTHNKLDPWTHNKAIQKSIESFRVTDENKKVLRSLRIKR